jgi:hypothetical protein
MLAVELGKIGRTACAETMPGKRTDELHGNLKEAVYTRGAVAFDLKKL